jgi:hypothetical protein
MHHETWRVTVVRTRGGRPGLEIQSAPIRVRNGHANSGARSSRSCSRNVFLMSQSIVASTAGQSSGVIQCCCRFSDRFPKLETSKLACHDRMRTDWWSAGDSVTARGPTPYWRTAMCADCVPTPSGESAEFMACSLSGVASGCHQHPPFDNPLVEVEFK